MKLVIKLALRNVRRNINSTLLNGIGISFSVIVLLFIFSLSRGIESQIVSNNIKFETGALSITFNEKTSSLENKISGDSLLKKISSTLNRNKHIDSYAYRIYPKKSLLYLSDNSQSINIIGMTQKEIPLLVDMLKLLSGKADFLHSCKGILISNGIADQYDLKIGEVCNIMLQSVDGSVNINDFVISGIFRYTSQMNKYNVYMDYDQTKLLYNTNIPTKILINLQNLDETDNVKKYLLTELNIKNSNKVNESNINGFQLTTYKDHLGMAKSLSGFNKYGMLSIAFFLTMISFVGIWSMQIENINDRKREIGTFLAMGFSLLSVKKIFIYESVILSVVYFIMGFIIVSVAIFMINALDGVYLGDSASFAFGSSIINPILNFKDVVYIFAIAFLYPLLATIISLKTLNKNNIIELLTGN